MKRKVHFLMVLTLELINGFFYANAQKVGDKFQHKDGFYYRITSLSPREVQLAPQDDDYPYWHNEEKPTGTLILSEQVVYNDKTYTVTSIGDYAFRGCKGLTGDLNIPESVTSIGESAFSHCSGFTGTLTLPNSIITIGESAFSDCMGFTGTLNIPNGVTSIGMEAFYDCSGFTGNLIIPSSVTSIGESAFQSCIGFTGDLILSNGVSSVGEKAFADCVEFNGNLVIPNSVMTIGMGAFYGCMKLKSVICQVSDPNKITVGDDIFGDVPVNNISLYVPKGSVSLYENGSQWKKFGNIIVYDNTGLASYNILTKPISVITNNILLSDIAGQQISLYDISGKLIINLFSIQENITIPVTQKGIYLLKVGNALAKIIIN